MLRSQDAASRKLLLARILGELRDRTGVDKIKHLLASCFPQQAAFVLDQSSLLAGFCTRRAGKSFGVGLKLIMAAMQNPGVSCLYIALTRDSANRIMVKDVLKAINAKYDLGAKFNEKPLTMTFKNGSVIYLLGMDSSEAEAQKALGQKFKLVVIDEAGSFRRDLHSIVYQILKPACADLRGQICLIGTPTDLVRGLFYDVVWAKTEKGWTIHRWSAFDNPYMRKQWQAEIAELKAAKPLIIETPWFRQQYLGEYVIDQSKLVYRYTASRNAIKRVDLPRLTSHVLGVDLGYDDASAFVILGFAENDKKLYIPHAHKESQLDITDVATNIKSLIAQYNPYKIIIDNAAKQSVEELKKRHDLPMLQAADKRGKADFIKIMNAEFTCANIKIVEEDAEPLITEYGNLIRDPRYDKEMKEHPACDNHACDAALYGWRFTYSYATLEKKKPLSEEEKLEIWADKEAEAITADAERPWWEQ